MQFIDEYFNNSRNGAMAYAIVYNTTSDIGRYNASKLLKKPEIMAEIDRRESEIKKKSEITLESITERLVRIADNNEKKRPQVALGAIKELSKIYGFDTPQKDFNDNDESKIPQNITIKIVTNNDNNSNDSI